MKKFIITTLLGLGLVALRADSGGNWTTKYDANGQPLISVRGWVEMADKATYVTVQAEVRNETARVLALTAFLIKKDTKQTIFSTGLVDIEAGGIYRTVQVPVKDDNWTWSFKVD